MFHAIHDYQNMNHMTSNINFQNDKIAASAALYERACGTEGGWVK